MCENEELNNYALARRRQEFKNMHDLQNYLKKCPFVRNQVEQAWLIFYWIAHNISYFTGASASSGSLANERSNPDIVLLKGNSVCAGFSNLFSFLCEQMDIECHEVIGYAKERVRRAEIGMDHLRRYYPEATTSELGAAGLAIPIV